MYESMNIMHVSVHGSYHSHSLVAVIFVDAGVGVIGRCAISSLL